METTSVEDDLTHSIYQHILHLLHCRAGYLGNSHTLKCEMRHRR